MPRYIAAPQLSPLAFPEEKDMEAASLISHGLYDLQNHVNAFESALLLFDYCLAQRVAFLQIINQPGADSPLPNIFDQPWLDWPLIAARDAGMTIHHFYVAFDGIRQTMATSQPIASLCDKELMKSADSLFKMKFRNFIDLRDSIAHVSDKMKNAKKVSEHAFTGSLESRIVRGDNLSRLTISNVLDGRKFTNTWEGKIVSYEISAESLAHLNFVKQKVWDAFAKASEETFSLMRTRLNPAAPAKPREPPT